MNVNVHILYYVISKNLYYLICIIYVTSRSFISIVFKKAFI